ncbi:MAG: 50S ribosomal protein L4, partial [Anaerolineaceae bacterium]|nr:50S ribosomal protein L4 [Anaerolineaceae bacterium]
RQKGTGRARQGSIRAAQWKGGGRIHTPHPRDYSQLMPRKMRRAALRSALSVKAAGENIVIVDEMKLSEQKTKMMIQAMEALIGNSSALILIPEKSPDFEVVIKSANNIPDVKTIMSSYLNIRDLLNFDKLIIPVAALEKIKAHLG